MPNRQVASIVETDSETLAELSIENADLDAIDVARENEALREHCRQLRVTIRRLEQLAYVDVLTGLANRRQFDAALDLELRRAHRSKRPLSLILCDVDNFKSHNDRLGHQSGDEILSALGVLLRSSLRRAGDVAARYGGDEFALLLPNMGVTDSLNFAEQLHRSVERAIDWPTVVASEIEISMTVGVTTYRSTNTVGPTDLVRAADMALYRAKAAGRGCTDYQPPAPSVP